MEEEPFLRNVFTDQRATGKDWAKFFFILLTGIIPGLIILLVYREIKKAKNDK